MLISGWVCGLDDTSLHHTVHHLLVAQKNTILDIAKQRDLEKRNQFKPNDDPKVAADIRAEQNATDFAGMEHFARTGYFYYPGMKVCTIADCLPPEQIAKRDIIRMRFMPKSPYEDRILAEEYDAVFEEERKINKESLLNYPLEGDWYEYERVIQERSDQIGDMDTYHRLARRVFIERLRNYNENRETAEKQIDERSAEIQAYLREKHHVRTESKFDQVLKANKAKMEKEKLEKEKIMDATGTTAMGATGGAPASDIPMSLTPDVVSRSPDRDTHPTEGLPNLNPKWRHMLCLPPLEQNDPHWKGSFASIFAPLLLTAITLWAILNAGLSNLLSSQSQLLTNQISIPALALSTQQTSPLAPPGRGAGGEGLLSSSQLWPGATGGSSASAPSTQHTAPAAPTQPPTHSPPSPSLFSSVSGPFPMPN